MIRSPMTSGCHVAVLAAWRASLAERREPLLQRVERHLDLLAGVEIAQRRGAARELVVAENDRGARVDLVGALQAGGCRLPE